MTQIDGHRDVSRSSNPKVLYALTSTDFGGAENGVRELCLRIGAYGFDPILCSLLPPGRMAREVADAGIPVFSLDLAEQARMWDSTRGVVRLARHLQRHQVDLVHSCLYRSNVISSLSSRLSRQRPKLVTSQHSLTPRGNDMKAGLLVKRTRRLSDRVVAVSRAVEEVLIRDGGVAPHRVERIDNGIDTSEFRLDGDNRLRGDLGIDEQESILLVVGRLAFVKGYDVLLRSLARLARKDLQCRLLVVGEGPELRALESLVEELEIADRVLFLGFRENVASIYGASDIFVLPSRREASPNALLEAMASGCAIIASAVGGVPEMVNDEDSALLVPPSDEIALAESLERLILDRGLRERLGTKAQEEASARWDVSVMVEKYAKLYRQLLET